MTGRSTAAGRLANRLADRRDAQPVIDDMDAAPARSGSPMAPEADCDALSVELLPGCRRLSAA